MSRLARGTASAVILLAAVVLGAAGGFLLVRADRGLIRTVTGVDGVPLTIVRAAGDGDARRPGAVVVHGFAGSARLMLPFAETLARHGYLVVLPDLSGHGANRAPFQTSGFGSDTLMSNVDTAVRFLRAQPQDDPGRTVLIGHSMGATAVVDYAASHPDIAATVALSLPMAPDAVPDHALYLYGQLEFPGFRSAADTATARAATTTKAQAVPGVEHISILFSGTAHERSLSWLNAAVRPGEPSLPVYPRGRLVGAGLVLLGLLLGFVPLAAFLSRLGGGGGSGRAERRPASVIAGPVEPAVALGGGLAAGGAVGLVAPDSAWGLMVGGYAALVFAGAAAGILVVETARLARGVGGRIDPQRHSDGDEASLVRGVDGRNDSQRHVDGSRRAWRDALLAVVMGMYAGLAVAVPTHLGLTYAGLIGPRIVPVVAVTVACWALFLAAERAAPLMSVVMLVAAAGLVTGLGLIGAGPGFMLLVAPLLVALLGIGAGFAAVLRRLGVRPWARAVAGAVVLAWPLATALPLV